MRASTRSYSSRAALTGVAATALLLGACGIGGGDDDESTDTTDAGDSEDAELSGEITFQTWNLQGGYEDYFNGLVADFEEQHPDTTINWIDQPPEGYQDKLSADAAAGTLPDVIDIGPEAAYTLASADMLLDLSQADPEAEQQYLPKSWEAMTFAGLGGGTYGYPWYLNTGPSFFNTELFDECGLDSSNLPTTFDELFDQAATMAEECPNTPMIGRMPAIETFGMYGVELMNDDGTEFTFNNPAGVELVQKYKDLYEAGGLTEDSLNEQQTGELEGFKSGHLGWLPGSSYTLQDLKETAPDVYENVAMGPLIANAAPNMYIQSIAVNAQSDNEDLAIEFARFVTNVDNQFAFSQQAAIFPSADGALDDPFFTEADDTDESRVRVEAAQQVEQAEVYWPPAFSSQSADYMREQIALAIQGDKSPQEALDESVAYANERLGSE
ncbi:sugar ABC transporter substrate-binding protein [Phytoactinopolyspora halotolerans]|uniref:Sugar ABC transporter substrate-binding protein n=2 Tax=Phytoactinopolyspora halotolerans TaxID=1981512 RepID=A0A6L9SF29_9ACTN|nr:sugar ABC transporter substrate-binding protein [Phytoactinopolyspora halotolerans]